MDSPFSLLPAQPPLAGEPTPVDKSTSGSTEEASGWLSGAVKVMSDPFASFTAMFKPSESSIFGQSKNLSDKVADQKNMFSSLRDWGSSFSLRDWIPKGISLSFGNYQPLFISTK